jgi:hypothetical protein
MPARQFAISVSPYVEASVLRVIWTQSGTEVQTFPARPYRYRNPGEGAIETTCLSGGGFRATFFHLGVILGAARVGDVGSSDIFSLFGLISASADPLVYIVSADITGNGSIWRRGSHDRRLPADISHLTIRLCRSSLLARM